MDSLASVIIIVICLILEGIFSGGELALVSADINKIRSLAKNGDPSARRALKLLERPEWFLATTLTGTNICVITSTVTATALFISLFGIGIGEFVAIAVMVPTILILGEIIPKSVFQQHAETVAIKVSWFIWFASGLLYPLVYLISRISRGTMRIAKKEKDLTSSYITKEGLISILQNQGAESDMLSIEREMVKRILDFSEVTVEGIMVNLSTMTFVSETTTIGQAAEVFNEKKHMRIPVYRDHLFNIIGVLNYFDLLAVFNNPAAAAPDETIVKHVDRRVMFVPENKPAQDLLVDMQEKGEKIAIVVDEYGGAVGMVTIEDILTEIVGTVEDKHEKYNKLAPGRYLVKAHISLETINQLLPVALPEGDYETLGGFLLYKMGKIPKRKESLSYGEVRFIIEEADVKAIREIMVVFPAQLEKPQDLR